ncbi:Ig-like domain-containing protein [Longimicrobium sp.]|uniref:Ig-like domain-containing protein n=1 Tax=Longimicrobium sp. TaxID=2029185 RepID=UPI002BDA42E6|nr:Ig-like domain-containing protein [Longimicrobium sp.]HSU14229.1 Ig-like domain-containing protein [Longimicrobium sp.]
MKAFRLFAAALMLPALAASCTDLPTGQARAPQKPRADLTGPFWINCTSSLTVGGTGHCSAYSYSGGFIYPSYWSTNPGVVSANSGGFLYGISPGAATIYASYGGYMASASVYVAPPPAPPVVTKVTVTSVSVAPGQSAQLTARAYDQYNNQMSGKTATWSIDNPAVATITSSGVVTGQALGSTTARATIDGVAGAGTVTVEDYQEPDNPMCGKYYC